jgi:hypothetical protein
VHEVHCPTFEWSNCSPKTSTANDFRTASSSALPDLKRRESINAPEALVIHILVAGNGIALVVAVQAPASVPLVMLGKLREA